MGRKKVKTKKDLQMGKGKIAAQCGHAALAEQSPFGPSPCRSIHRCSACGEPVEVVRSEPVEVSRR